MYWIQHPLVAKCVHDLVQWVIAHWVFVDPDHIVSYCKARYGVK